MGRDGVITEDYTGDRNFKGNVSFAQGASGASFNFIKKDTQIWYVDSGKSAPAASFVAVNIKTSPFANTAFCK